MDFGGGDGWEIAGGMWNAGGVGAWEVWCGSAKGVGLGAARKGRRGDLRFDLEGDLRVAPGAMGVKFGRRVAVSFAQVVGKGRYDRLSG